MISEINYHKHGLLIVIILYSILTILFFYPCLNSFSSSLIGPPEDNMQHLWDMWWVRKVFVDHFGALSFSNYIFYPQGSSLLFHAYSFYNLALSFVLGLFLNMTATYNLLILATFVLAGVGAFLLIKYLTNDAYISLIGGFIFAFSPTHYAHSLHHIEIASIQFIPLFVLYFIKLIKDGSRKNLLLVTLFFFLNSICSLYYFALAIYFMIFSYIYLIFKEKRLILPRVIANYSLIIGSTVIILSPWLLKMIRLGLKLPEIAQEGHNIFVVDLLALIIPHPYHLLGNTGICQYFNHRFTGNTWELTAYLGIINILVILIAFKGIIKKTKLYILAAFVFLVLSMGSHLHILGKETPIILPYEIIARIPLLSIMRTPSRAVIYVYLFFAIITSFALKHIFDSYTFKSAKKELFLSLFLLLGFLDYYSACAFKTRVYCPPAYKVIRPEGKKFGILDLPLFSYLDAERYMMYQTFHGFPIVDGSISHKVGKSLIDYLDAEDIGRQKVQLSGNNVKYIVIHKKFVPQEVLFYITNEYNKYYKTVYADKDNTVFQVY